MSERTDLYRRFHFPAGVISHAVWLYARFALRYRNVEELLGERGIQVRYESVRRWVGRFGEHFAAELRRRERRSGRTGHLDEIFVRIGGEQRYLWRVLCPPVRETLKERRTGSVLPGTRAAISCSGGAKS